jgi:hypothetical protein
MKQLLEQPVEYGDVQLAPTTELAGLAEFASLRDHSSRLEAIIRIANAVQSEDDERTRIADLRRAGAAGPLPTRGRT